MVVTGSNDGRRIRPEAVQAADNFRNLFEVPILMQNRKH